MDARRNQTPYHYWSFNACYWRKEIHLEVDVRANKIQVRQAVEEIFGVKVEKAHLKCTLNSNVLPSYGGYTNKRKAIRSLQKIQKIFTIRWRSFNLQNENYYYNRRK